jgi:hypothetical protein
MSRNLNEFIESNSKFLSFEENVPVRMKYLGCEICTSSFDPKKEVVVYTMEIEGKEKLWRTSSLHVSKAFAKLEKGDFVEISRTGDGRSTRYTIRKI